MLQDVGLTVSLYCSNIKTNQGIDHKPVQT